MYASHDTLHIVSLYYYFFFIFFYVLPYIVSYAIVVQ
jgi:hypothetical protein